MKEPLTFSKGQYLPVDVLLHVFMSTHFISFISSFFMLAEARTSWSDRFLLWRSPKMISDSESGRDFLVLPRISQFPIMISLIGGLWGLCVVTQ